MIHPHAQPESAIPTTETTMRHLTLCTLLAIPLLALACDAPPDLETRTFGLNRLQGAEAADLARGYGTGEGDVTVTDRTLTVRAAPDELDRVALVLSEYDRGPATVVLRFQVIEADGAGGSDPAIAEVEEALRDLFRYEGYRLEAEAVVRTTEYGHFEQIVAGEDGQYRIAGRIRDVSDDADADRVFMDVELHDDRYGSVLGTSVNAAVGRTVVLGSARPDPAAGALVLVVRPELGEG